MKENAKQVKLTIDGHEITVDGSLTILEAARQNGIDIPTLCHHPALSNWGGCRLCVVEVDQSPKLAAACVMPVRNGMEVVTNSTAITASRRLSLEFLFAERNHNCMFCPESGDCELQKMAYALQMDHLTVSQSFNAFPTDVTGEYMTIDHNRCILCGRCVRACQEIAGSYVLGFHNRGPNTLIGFDLLEKREASTCINCGACLQVCPTGAISSRYRTHYAVKGQPSGREAIASVCAGCGLLCPTQAVVRDNQLIKIEGLLGAANGRPDRGQLCYKGRFEVLKTHGSRLVAPMVKDSKGRWQVQSWAQARDHINEAFATIRNRDGAAALFGIASSGLSNEALMLFKALMTDGWGTEHVDTLDGDHFRNLVAPQDDWADGLPPEASWKKVSAGDMVLIVGADPQQSHPMLVSLLRRALVEKALPIAAIGMIDRASLFCTEYLPTSDEALPSVLNALIGTASSLAKPVSAKTALNSEQQASLGRIAQAYVAAKAPLILAGNHLTELRASAALQDLFKLARLKEGFTGQSAFVTFLKPAGNSMAAWRLGVAAHQAFNSDVRGGLLLLDDEVDRALAVLAGLRQAPAFLAVITPYFNAALAEIAHVMLPKPLWLEEDGSYTSMEGAETVYKPKVIDPPGGVKRTWEILQDLARGIDAPGVAGSWEVVRTKADQLLAVG